MATPSKSPVSPDPATAVWGQFRTSDGVFAVDSQQRIMYWSARAQQMLGHHPGDVLGKPCYEVIGGRDSRNHNFCRRNCPVIANARRGRPTPDYDILCTLPTGEEKWLNISVLVPPKSQGGFLVLYLFRDVSQRRRTEEFARKISTALRPLLDETKADAIGTHDTSPVPLPKLSRRELEVLRLLATGIGTKEIAATLSVKAITARNHISRVLTRLGVENRLQAVLYASQHRLI